MFHRKIFKEQNSVFVWRMMAIAVCAVWLISFCMRVFVLDDLFIDNPSLLSKQIFYGYNAVFFAALCSLIFFPFMFRIYAICFSLAGLLRIIGGETIIGLFMYLLGGAFAFKQGYFRTYNRLKTTVVTALLLGALATQLRYGFAVLVQTLLTYILLALMITLALLLYLPEIKKLLHEQQTAALMLPAAQFSERDVKILERVLSGAKYDAIAREEGVALITFKKYIRNLFYRIGVSDRTNFFARYSNHTIQLTY